MVLYGRTLGVRICGEIWHLRQWGKLLLIHGSSFQFPLKQWWWMLWRSYHMVWFAWGPNTCEWKIIMLRSWNRILGNHRNWCLTIWLLGTLLWMWGYLLLRRRYWELQQLLCLWINSRRHFYFLAYLMLYAMWHRRVWINRLGLERVRLCFPIWRLLVYGTRVSLTWCFLWSSMGYRVCGLWWWLVCFISWRHSICLDWRRINFLGIWGLINFFGRVEFIKRWANRLLLRLVELIWWDWLWALFLWRNDGTLLRRSKLMWIFFWRLLLFLEWFFIWALIRSHILFRRTIFNILWRGIGQYRTFKRF